MEEELVQSSLHLLRNSVHPEQLGSCFFNGAEVLLLCAGTLWKSLVRHCPGVVALPAVFVLSVTMETARSSDSGSSGNQSGVAVALLPSFIYSVYVIKNGICRQDTASIRPIYLVTMTDELWNVRSM